MKSSDRAAAVAPSRQQLLMSLFAMPQSQKRDKQLQLNRLIAMWIARDLLPFSLPEKPGFKEMMGKLVNFNLSVPTGNTVMDGILDIYASLEQDLANFFKDVRLAEGRSPFGIVVSADCWTSPARDGLSCLLFCSHGALG